MPDVWDIGSDRLIYVPLAIEDIATEDSAACSHHRMESYRHDFVARDAAAVWCVPSVHRVLVGATGLDIPSYLNACLPSRIAVAAQLWWKPRAPARRPCDPLRYGRSLADLGPGNAIFVKGFSIPVIARETDCLGVFCCAVL